MDFYTIVLSTRDYRHLGQIAKIQADSVDENRNLNSANEMSFSIIKSELIKATPKNGNVLSNDEYEKYLVTMNNLWDKIVDHRLIWVKELNEYYTIKVSVDDSAEVIKTITATSLCESELSQYSIDNLEANTKDDLDREESGVTIFYNEADPSCSLLHRVLVDKAPHYTIMHVDESLKNLQRTFSVSGTSIYDFLIGECAEQFNCIFLFDSTNRGIYVYDLYTVCLDCNHREDFYDVCPKCGSKNLQYFGEDTAIFIDKNNLTDAISFESNADETKNCLKLVAGDELMTSTIRLLNQNGSDYLYYLSDFQLQDMPEELVEKLREYNDDYDSYTEEYQELVSQLYDLTDEILYLESGKLPDTEQSEITTETEVAKLTEENLSPLGISKVTTGTTVATVNAALLNYAKVFVKTGYVKVEVVGESTFDFGETNDETGISFGTWTGKLRVTSTIDDTDWKETPELNIVVDDNYGDFIGQKILKNINNEDEEGSVFNVLAIEEVDNYKEALLSYNRDMLQSFYDAIQGALDILIEIDQSTESADLYDVLYEPYYEKLLATQEQLDSIQTEIDILQEELDNVDARITEIQDELNFRTYLGEDFYKIYCAYRREDVYSNDNFFSEGLSNKELIERAKEFIELAKKELKKSAEPQYTIIASLKNLLKIDVFKPIIKKFKLGNWIRVKVENTVYRLRLINYGGNIHSDEDISVQFSTATKSRDIVSEAQEVIKSAQSMSTTFGYVKKQAEQGMNANSDINDWKTNGLNSALINIKNNENGEVVEDKHGLLFRLFDEETGKFSPKQLRIFHNILVFTADGWKTCRQAIGEHIYRKYDYDSNKWNDVAGYGVTSDFMVAGTITGSEIVGGHIYSSNYNRIKTEDKNREGSYINLLNGSFDFAGGGLTYNPDDGGLKIESTAIESMIGEVDVVAAKMKVKAENIDGNILYSQIEDTPINHIKSDNIESLDASKINGQILDSQIEKVSASKISGELSSSNIPIITNEKIDNISTSKLSGTITNDQISEISASKISGQVANSQIESVAGSKISGTIDASKLRANSQAGATEDIAIGDITLRFVNGLFIGVI